MSSTPWKTLITTWTGWTNLWRMLHVSRGKYHKVIQGLHEKYGPVVRIGPNVLSLNYPSLVKVIYNTKDNYRKVSRKRFIIIIAGCIY